MAALVAGDEPRALRHLVEMAALRPAPDNIERIESGLERVRRDLNLDSEAVNRWCAALRGQD